MTRTALHGLALWREAVLFDAPEKKAEAAAALMAAHRRAPVDLPLMAATIFVNIE